MSYHETPRGQVSLLAQLDFLGCHACRVFLQSHFYVPDDSSPTVPVTPAMVLGSITDDDPSTTERSLNGATPDVFVPIHHPPPITLAPLAGKSIGEVGVTDPKKGDTVLEKGVEENMAPELVMSERGVRAREPDAATGDAYIDPGVVRSDDGDANPVVARDFESRGNIEEAEHP